MAQTDALCSSVLSCHESAESAAGKIPVITCFVWELPSKRTGVQQKPLSLFQYLHTTPHQKSVPDVPRGTSELQKGCGQRANGNPFPGVKKTANTCVFLSSQKHSSSFSSWSKSRNKVWMLSPAFLPGNPWIQGKWGWGTVCDISMGCVGLWWWGDRFQPKVGKIFPCNCVGTLWSSL